MNRQYLCFASLGHGKQARYCHLEHQPKTQRFRIRVRMCQPISGCLTDKPPKPESSSSNAFLCSCPRRGWFLHSSVAFLPHKFRRKTWALLLQAGATPYIAVVNNEVGLTVRRGRLTRWFNQQTRLWHSLTVSCLNSGQICIGVG